MKVLLYEPGSGGHRDVVLRYVQKVLYSSGHSFVTVRSLAENRGSEIQALQQLAVEERCDVVHILTADGCARRWLRESLSRRRHGAGIPVVATYYLFNNIYKMGTGLLWDYLHVKCGISRLLISDDFIGERHMPRWRRDYVRFLTDPWDPEEFQIFTKADACGRLGLDPSRKRMLVFGEISRRKQIDLVIQAYRRVMSPDTELLLAGRWHPSLTASLEEFEIDRLVSMQRAQVRRDVIPEADVSAYFCSSDVVICAYPKWFAVSSGTFTRACAAARPVIAAAHGVIGRLVVRNGCGVTYEAANTASLVRAMRRALCGDYGSEYGFGARELAQSRVLDRYAEQLIAVYSECLA